MTALELISLCQRMAGSIKADVEKGEKDKALGKLEILEGELSVNRKDFEPKPKEEVNGSVLAPSMPDDIIDIDEVN